jgi:hypothetical protein
LQIYVFTVGNVEECFGASRKDEPVEVVAHSCVGGVVVPRVLTGCDTAANSEAISGGDLITRQVSALE